VLRTLRLPILSLMSMALITSACGSRAPINSSLTDLLGETSYETWCDPQRSFSSIAGILPPPFGSAGWSHVRKNPLSAVYYGGPATQVRHGVIGADITFQEVIAIREAIEDYQKAVVDKVGRDLELAVQRNEQTEHEHNGQTNEALNAKILANATQTKTTADMEAKRKILRAAMSKPGLMILRWSASSDDSVTAEVGDAGDATDTAGGAGANVTGRATLKRTGYTVLGGLRISSLLIGDDLIAACKRTEGGKFDDNFKFITTAIAARHIVYSNGFESVRRLQADINFNAQKLSLSSVDKARLSLSLASALDIGNMGTIGSVTWTLQAITHTQSGLPAIAAALSKADTSPDKQSWLTVYQHATSLDAIAGMFIQNSASNTKQHQK